MFLFYLLLGKKTLQLSLVTTKFDTLTLIRLSSQPVFFFFFDLVIILAVTACGIKLPMYFTLTLY